MSIFFGPYEAGHGGAAEMQAAFVAAEERRSAEVAALEWKLRETRRRHLEELSHFGAESLSTDFNEVGWHDGGSWPSGHLSRCGTRPERQNQDRGLGTVLAILRRSVGGHSIRLWVEDLTAVGGARLHAVDETSGARTHRDVSDATLSGLLAAFKVHMPGVLGELDDIDEFLHALLGACHIRAAGGRGLEILLPALDQAPKVADVSYVSQSSRGHGGHENATSTNVERQRLLPQGTVAYDGMIPGYVLRPETSNMVPSQAWVIRPREPSGRPPLRPPWQPPHSESSASREPAAAPQAPPRPMASRHAQLQATPARELSTREERWTSRTPSRPQALSSSAQELSRAQEEARTCWTSPAVSSRGAPSPGAPCLDVRGPEGNPDNQARLPVSTVPSLSVHAPCRPPGRPTGRPTPSIARGRGDSGGHSRDHVRDEGQGKQQQQQPPRRVPMRPQSAPHGGRRPQSARFQRDDGQVQKVPSRVQPEATLRSNSSRRRVRPSSAKALKHRRVIDDGADSIIYEDIEEENEEPFGLDDFGNDEEELPLPTSSLQRETGTRRQRGNQASQKRLASSGGTGGCSSSSSRSVSRSRLAPSRSASQPPSGPPMEPGRDSRSVSRGSSAASEEADAPLEEQQVEVSASQQEFRLEPKLDQLEEQEAQEESIAQQSSAPGENEAPLPQACCAQEAHNTPAVPADGEATAPEASLSSSKLQALPFSLEPRQTASRGFCEPRASSPPPRRSRSTLEG
eukprot:TRINITY_DN6346_c0_g1_i1.p1 TRINITY_DN6346_c0_g1~~TRINITY_DN6346_c0_g1_i1.p1  ORF type:complete len:743 (-),score=123.68 TRINITY_DN6346_c0_g1_i1:86-2314(-)